MSKASTVSTTYSPQEVILQEELAAVYFSDRKALKKPPRMPRAAPLRRVRRIRLVTAVPALLGVALVVSLAFFIPKFYTHDTAILRQRLAGASAIKALEGGRVSRSLIARSGNGGLFALAGAAARDGFVTLGNGGAAPSMTHVTFKFPLDLSGRIMVMTVKGKRGGEAMTVSLRDADRRSFRFDGVYLESRWTEKKLALRPIAGTVDLSRIEDIGIEFEAEGAGDAGSMIEHELYLKDIRFVRQEEAL